MTEFPAISIKMAKDQDLAPNPSKISGVCGRLLCCLSFEVEQYRELRGGLPKVGKNVTTPVGRARVLSINLLSGVARLRLEHTGEVIELSTDALRAQFGTAVRPEELEEVVEAPLRERQAQLDRDFLAVLSPVAERASARVVVTEIDLEGSLEADAEDGAPEGGEAGEDGHRKRRRRGRRGGRRRRGEGAAQAEGASEEAEATPAD
jgi:hypothetical protein